MKARHKIFFVFFSLLLLFCNAQRNLPEKNLQQIKEAKNDSEKVNALCAAGLYFTSSTPDSGLYYLKQAESIAARNGSERLKAIVNCGLGRIYFYNSQYTQALAFAISGSDYWKKNDRLEFSNSLQLLANCYTMTGDLNKALDNSLQALKIKEELKDSANLSVFFNQIGAIYYYKKDNEKAIPYFKKALALAKLKGNKTYMCEPANNIGIAEIDRKNYSEALIWLNQSLQLAIETENTMAVIRALGNLGLTYQNMDKPDSAIAIYNRCLYMQKKNNMTVNTGETYVNMGEIYCRQKKYKEAVSYTLSGMRIGDSIGQRQLKQQAMLNLSQIYSETGKHKEAFEILKQATELSDSLMSDENNKAIYEMEAKYSNEKNEKELVLKSAEIKKQQIEGEKNSLQKKFLWVGMGLCGLLFVIAGISYYNKRKDNKLILQQKNETEKQKLLVDAKNIQIEEKNKEMRDSIIYAKRIQSSLLASSSLLSKNLSEYFVLYKPKDIVSGDFYWATEIRKLRPGKMFSEKGSVESKGVNETSDFIFVCGDCTGHGVPGAFMSLLNISKLNETINEKKINRPGPILDSVRKEIIAVLNPEGDNESKNNAVNDGMDCTLLRFDFETMTLNYAAANNSFYLLRDGKINICPADKMPVGKSPTEEKPFSTYSFAIQKGDLIYVLTDGFADQFGGRKGKKFKYKPLQELLSTHSQKSLSEQKSILETAFTEWKGELEQIDDVLIIGIRV